MYYNTATVDVTYGTFEEYETFKESGRYQGRCRQLYGRSGYGAAMDQERQTAGDQVAQRPLSDHAGGLQGFPGEVEYTCRGLSPGAQI